MAGYDKFQTDMAKGRLPGKNLFIKNKLLSEVKTANRYGVLMVNHSII